MNNRNIQSFESNEFGKLEVLMIGSKPYFPASECAKILGYSTPNDAIKRHCKGIVKHDTLTKGGKQQINVIPEGDLLTELRLSENGMLGEHPA